MEVSQRVVVWFCREATRRLLLEPRVSAGAAACWCARAIVESTLTPR